MSFASSKIQFQCKANLPNALDTATTSITPIIVIVRKPGPTSFTMSMKLRVSFWLFTTLNGGTEICGNPVSTLPVRAKGPSKVSGVTVVKKKANNVPMMTAKALRPSEMYLQIGANLPLTSFNFY